MGTRSQRRLATVLFVDIVDSTRVASEIGDRSWRELVGAFRASVRRELKRFGGREVDTAGDGFFCWFDQPANAIKAAAAIVAAVQQRGLEVRCGVHTGELEEIDGRLGGIAAHIGARVMALAEAGQVVVTSTVRELVVGADVQFETVAETELKGVPGRWTLHRAVSVDGQPLPTPLDVATSAERKLARAIAPPRRRMVAAGTAVAVMAVVGLALVYRFGGFGPTAQPSSSPSATASASLFANPSSTARASPSSPASGSPSASPLPVALVAIDPVRNAISEIVRDDHGGHADALIADAGNLWVDERGTTLTRRDLTSGAYLTSIEVNDESFRVELGFGSIWVTHGEPFALIDRLDPLSGRLIAQIDPKVEVADSAIGTSAVYLLTDDFRIISIDPFSNTPDEGVPTGRQPVPAFLGFNDGMLYIHEASNDRLAIFDPATGAVVQVVENPLLGRGPFTLDPNTRTLWMLDWEGSTITPFDLDTNTVGVPVGLAGNPRSVAIGFNSVWVAAETFVYRIEPGSQNRSDIAMPPGVVAASIGIDAEEEVYKLWVGNCTTCE